MRLIDADALCEGLVSNHPVVIAAKCAPTIDAEPVRHGRWVRKTGNGYYWYECSECGAKPLKNSYKDDCFSYSCPHCGAKMDGGADNA